MPSGQQSRCALGYPTAKEAFFYETLKRRGIVIYAMGSDIGGTENKERERELIVQCPKDLQ